MQSNASSLSLCLLFISGFELMKSQRDNRDVILIGNCFLIYFLSRVMGRLLMMMDVNEKWHDNLIIEFCCEFHLSFVIN